LKAFLIPPFLPSLFFHPAEEAHGSASPFLIFTPPSAPPLPAHEQMDEAREGAAKPPVKTSEPIKRILRRFSWQQYNMKRLSFLQAGSLTDHFRKN
jgi:hypothetical protein